MNIRLRCELDTGRLRRIAIWLALAVAACLSHFWALGDRAMSHDESMHAWYSWLYATTGAYTHLPGMHGPLLYHLDALAFLVLGDSDATARLFPALAGLGVAAMLLLFGRWMGRTAARMAAVLSLLSPTLLFYSRYIRNDLYMALFALVWVYGLFRYLETPRRRWLAVVTAGMTLSFACKETVYITGLTFGGWLAALALVRTLSPRFGPRPEAGAVRPPAGPAADLAVFTLVTALPFASALGLRACGWDPCDWDTRTGQRHALGMQAVFALAGLVAAGGWLALRRLGADRETRPDGRAWLVCAGGFWLFQITLYTALFSRIPQGLASGVSGGLGYWLTQHGVSRGGQPWFYYLMLAALYDFLPLTLAACGVVRVFVLQREQPSPFFRFCVVWALASLVLYSWAGEKMPWLLVHSTLPLCLLGAVWAAGYLERARRQLTPRRPALALLLCVPILFYAFVNLPAAGPFDDRTIEQVRNSMRGLRVAAALLLAGWLAWRSAPRLKEDTRWRCMLAGVLALMVAWTARTAFQLTFVNGDRATEPLVYAHGMAGVTRAARQAQNLQCALTGQGTPVVAFDDLNSWPFCWYFRNMRYLDYGTNATAAILAAPMILCDNDKADAVRALTRDGYIEEVFPAIAWPLEGYKQGLLTNLQRLLDDPRQRHWLRQVLLFRDYPDCRLEVWPLRKEVHVFRCREKCTWSDLGED